MNARDSLLRWRLPLAIAALGCVACMLAYGGPDGHRPAGPSIRTAEGRSVPTAAKRTMHNVGPGVPAGLPVLPPVVVRPEVHMMGEVMPSTTRAEGRIAAPGDPCQVGAACNDCDLCTFDRCANATCQGGDRDGLPCTSDSQCDGFCDGGANHGEYCTSQLDCCDELGEDHGTCDFRTCSALSAKECVNWPIPYRCDGGDYDRRACDPDYAGSCPGGTCEPGFQEGAECDDGLFCNGGETCDPDLGECLQGDPPCAPSQRCDERDDACLPLCTGDGDCDDGMKCTDDKCDTTGSVTGMAGECYVGAPPCGPGGYCTEPENPNDPVICSSGRCCDSYGACSDDTYPDCDNDWLATRDACGTLQSGQANGCPAYGSGIADQGEFHLAVGPIVADSPCPAHTLERLGDDYSIDSDVVDTSSGYVDVHIVRLALSVEVRARLVVEFLDPALGPDWPPLLGYALFPEYNARLGGPAIYTALFDPPLTIPVDGVLALSVRWHFAHFGAVRWLSTDAVDVGTNNATTMFTDEYLITGNFLGKCIGGGRDGEWCDATHGDDDCPNGACDDSVPDVMAFEMVVEEAESPVGACCDSYYGTCDEMLPWICEDYYGNTFQGSGTSCTVCNGNSVVECDVDDDCTACDGGDRVNEKCGSAACPNGSCVGLVCNGGDNHGGSCNCPDGSCVYVGPCGDVRPACTLHACCSDYGDCAIGFCDEDPFKPCNDYEDSTDCGAGETCVLVDPYGGLECPPGWWEVGYGHDCDPNCCEQPYHTGGDTCMEADPLWISVGAPGEVRTVTTSGYNGYATFDDFNEFVCDGGDYDGDACDPNADCPEGVCVDSTCDGGSNDGNACDPDSDCPGGVCRQICGWDQFDPNGTIRDPGWWEAFVLDEAADVRIDLCCTRHWSSHDGSNVMYPAWTQIFAGCPCESAVHPTGVDTPVGLGYWATAVGQGGPFCDDQNTWMTFGPLPSGIYYVPIYSGYQGTSAVFPDQPGTTAGDYQLHVTVSAALEAACCGEVCVGGDRDGQLCKPDGGSNWCPGGTCGDTIGCDVVNELVCEAAGGFWLAGKNLPDSETDPVLTCDGGPCNTGSCCLGGGECDDGDMGEMNEAQCEDGNDGEYVGGAKCDWRPPHGPCPLCPAAVDEDNCQASDGSQEWYWSIDRTNGAVRKRADDFVAASSEIGELCISPCFYRTNENHDYTGECAVPAGNPPPPPDDFEIRFYEDVDGLPGDELASSPGPVAVADKRYQGENGGDGRCWDYTFSFDPPITGFTAGRRYWMEFSGAGSPPPPGGTGCTVFVHGTLAGNGWSLAETDHYGLVVWGAEDVFDYREDGLPLDWAFCLGGGLWVPEPMTGACCECDGTCTDEIPWEDCLGYYNAEGDDVVWYGPKIGWFAPLQSCDQITCEDRTVPDSCTGEPSATPGEDCGNKRNIGVGSHAFSNLCSTTDGPGSFEECDTGSDVGVGADLWFEYHACGDERMIDVDVCDTDFDAVLAIYTNGTTVCPSECPPDEQWLVDDMCHDEDCPMNGPTASVYAETAGQCFIILVGGNQDYASAEISRGRGDLEVDCGGCYPSSPPEYERLDLTFNPISQKIRYVSFTAGDAGRTQAVRVTFHDLPSPYEDWNDVQLYVQEPQRYCENSGQTDPPAPNSPPNYGCGGSGGLVPPWFWGAELGCDPYFTDWTQYDFVHVWDEGLIPNAEYDLQVIDEGCTALLDWENDPRAWSPAVRWTQSDWADLVRDCATCPCSQPEGFTTIPDVTAVLDKFKNLPCCVKKARADLEGSPTGDARIPDQAINITDVTRCLGAFLGEDYPPSDYPPPSPPPICW